MHGSGIIEMFDKFTEFENALINYTGAPCVVLTDCCTHAIELYLRLKNIKQTVTIPYKSYISVPMTFHKLGIDYQYDTNVEWQYEYRIAPTNIWDSARLFDQGMYRAGQVQCLSFGYSKRLEIGHGGAILLSNPEEARILREMSYDGRDFKNISPWEQQKEWRVGYHYRPSIEDCIKGLYMLEHNKLKTKESQQYYYPDLTKIKITG